MNSHSLGVVELMLSVFGTDIDEIINTTIQEKDMLHLKATKEDHVALRQAELQSSSLRGHIPGRIHRHEDGTTYVVQPNGAWRKTVNRFGGLTVFGILHSADAVR